METKQIIDKKSEYWKKKLIDLSNRNNLVSYRFTKSKSLQVKQPEAKQVIEDLYHESNVHILKKENGTPKERLWLCTEDEEVVDKKLTNLYLKTKENFQESTTQQTKTPLQTKETIPSCEGCLDEEKCIALGTRIIRNEEPVYCDEEF